MSMNKNRIMELAGVQSLTEMKNGGKYYDKKGMPKDIQGAQTVDFKASPDEVLEAVDQQLKAFGLHVVTYQTDSDDIVWTIKK